MIKKSQKYIGILLAIFFMMIISGFTLPDVVRDFELSGKSLHERISKDGKPPTVILLVNQPTGNNGWHNKPVFVKVKAYDEGKGLVRAEVSLGGSKWYRDAMMINIDGEFMIMGKAVDQFGNVGYAQQLIKVDLTPPDITLDMPEPNGDNHFYVSAVSVTLAGEDKLSGVVDTQLYI